MYLPWKNRNEEVREMAQKFTNAYCFYRVPELFPTTHVW